VIVAECWEWLGKGGYADNRKGIIGKIMAFYDRLTELRVERIFDHIIAISSVLKKRFRDSGNVTVLRGGAENSELVSLGIDIARRRVRLSADSFIVGMSNVCASDHKDNELFFEAFGKLSREYSGLFIVLTGSDGGYIKEVGRRYGFAEKVIFPGWVEFGIYNAYLSACNVFVLPLPNTPINAGRWPNKIGDYLCLNRPILSNPTGDVEDLFREYRVGILCDHSSAGFYTALKALIEKENLEECSKDAPYVANETLAFDKRIESLLAIFKTKLVGRGRSIELPSCTD